MSCPVTKPPVPAFIPPAPYLSQSSEVSFYYGTEKLWTRVRPVWVGQGLPRSNSGYRELINWWTAGYDYRADPKPPLMISGKRLDREGSFSGAEWHGGYAPDIGSAIIFFGHNSRRRLLGNHRGIARC